MDDWSDVQLTIKVHIMVAVDSCLNLAHIALLSRQCWFANLGWWFRGIYLLHAVGILVDELGEIFNDAGAPSPFGSFVTLEKIF